MKAVRLHSARDMRVEDLPDPQAPGAGDVLIRVGAVGVCGSDLHMYQDGRIGDTQFSSPLVIGHEFMGEIIAVGEGARDGRNNPLVVGQRVAVDPQTPCYRCEQCEQGNPNLCPHHTFYGVYPTNGALQEQMLVHARNCFPLPDNISDGGGALLETLGIAIHSVALGKVRVADSVAVIGCGPVGLLIIKMLKLAGAAPIYACDCFPWRVEKALEMGADAAWVAGEHDPVKEVQKATRGRGVDIAFEAAWADKTVQQAADMARDGGRVILVGIPGDDRLQLQHSTARRKGLTLKMVRRMKHTYERAIHLASSGMIDLDALVSHTVPLSEARSAFEMNIAYEPGVQKIIVKA
ncbi:MAG: alcohol dehydrogenase catalytic domain-containing protein [Anaerolineae bacterium]